MCAHVFQLPCYFLTFLPDLSENTGLGSLQKGTFSALVSCCWDLAGLFCCPPWIPVTGKSRLLRENWQQKLTLSTGFEKPEQFCTYFHWNRHQTRELENSFLLQPWEPWGRHGAAPALPTLASNFLFWQAVRQRERCWGFLFGGASALGSLPLATGLTLSKGKASRYLSSAEGLPKEAMLSVTFPTAAVKEVLILSRL